MKQITMEAARVNAGMTQEDVANRLGISRAYYNRIESGKVSVKPIYFLGFCQLVGVSIDDIILPRKST
jgi:transcriptional regulator with XRE-family HTH domain